jgi:hypothetical protein
MLYKEEGLCKEVALDENKKGNRNSKTKKNY